MHEKNAVHIIEASEKLGIGNSDYELISIDSK